MSERRSKGSTSSKVRLFSGRILLGAAAALAMLLSAGQAVAQPSWTCRTSCIAGSEYRADTRSCSISKEVTGVRCSACSTCSNNQYETRACGGSDGTQNRTCGDCTAASCTAGASYAIGNCPNGDVNHKVRCTGCTTCQIPFEHQMQACTPTSDTVCAACTAGDCQAGQYISAACGLGFNVCDNCKTSCPADNYMSGTCDGRSTTDTINCVGCKTNCGSGNYVTGTCPGTGTSDTKTCTACKTSCPAGDYMSGTCSGTGTTDTIACPACKATCGSGKYMIGTCSGTSTSDTIGCGSCKTTCGTGKYMSGTCSGTGTSDTIACPSCRTSCGAGYYINGTCPGNLSYDNTAKACTLCKTEKDCAADEYLSGTCDGTSRTDTTQCVKCSGACPDGQQVAVACTRTADRICTACPTSCPSPNMYLTGSCSCLTCSGDCPAGQYEASACTVVADRVCAACSGACPAGTYEVSACTAKADRVCAPYADAGTPVTPDAAPVTQPDAAADTVLGPINVPVLDAGVDSEIDTGTVIPSPDVAPVFADVGTGKDTQLDIPISNPDGGDTAPVLGPDAATPDTTKPGVDTGVGPDTTVVTPTLDGSVTTPDATAPRLDAGTVTNPDSAVVVPPVDSGTVTPGTDAAVAGKDAGKGGSSDSGCSCNMGGRSSSRSMLGGLFLALGLAVTAIRRRKRG
jgi:hypothetical protein